MGETRLVALPQNTSIWRMLVDGDYKFVIRRTTKLSRKYFSEVCIIVFLQILDDIRGIWMCEGKSECDFTTFKIHFLVF